MDEEFLSAIMSTVSLQNRLPCVAPAGQRQGQGNTTTLDPLTPNINVAPSAELSTLHQASFEEALDPPSLTCIHFRPNQ